MHKQVEPDLVMQELLHVGGRALAAEAGHESENLIRHPELRCASPVPTVRTKCLVKANGRPSNPQSGLRYGRSPPETTSDPPVFDEALKRISLMEPLTILPSRTMSNVGENQNMWSLLRGIISVATVS